MSDERRKILDMLASGAISADDAERLLERLAGGTGTAHPHGMKRSASEAATAGGGATGFVLVKDDAPRRSAIKHRLRFLRIVVTSADEERVNVRIPLAFVRTGLKLSTMLPPKTHERLLEKGVDLSTLSALEGDELIDALRDLKINVDCDDGDSVRIYCV